MLKEYFSGDSVGLYLMKMWGHQVMHTVLESRAPQVKWFEDLKWEAVILFPQCSYLSGWPCLSPVTPGNSLKTRTRFRSSLFLPSIITVLEWSWFCLSSSLPSASSFFDSSALIHLVGCHHHHCHLAYYGSLLTDSCSVYPLHSCQNDTSDSPAGAWHSIAQKPSIAPCYLMSFAYTWWCPGLLLPVIDRHAFPVSPHVGPKSVLA